MKNEVEMKNENLISLKPFLSEFLSYYYNTLCMSGTELHLVMGEGNVDNESIMWCKAMCELSGDSFGVFLCDILLLLTEDELIDILENESWMWGGV